MIRINNYSIDSEFALKIALLSDIHFSSREQLYKFANIVSSLKESNPDYICIPGDTIDYLDLMNDKDLLNALTVFFVDLTSICPVVVSIGNHDLMTLDKTINADKKMAALLAFLKKIKGLYILNNESIEFDKINFIGITQDSSIPANDIDEVARDTMDKLQPFTSLISDNKLNCLLLHNPTVFESKTIPEDMFGIDLVLSGHMHNGCIPIGLDKVLKTHRGLIYPSKKLFPKLARGFVHFKNFDLVISKGVTTFSKTSKFFQKLNFLFPQNIEILDIGEHREEVKNRVRR